MMRDCVLKSLRHGFNLEITQDLFEVETGKLVHLIMASVFFGDQYNLFVTQEYNQRMKNLGLHQRISMDEFNATYRMQLNN